MSLYPTLCTAQRYREPAYHVQPIAVRTASKDFRSHVNLPCHRVGALGALGRCRSLRPSLKIVQTMWDSLYDESFLNCGLKKRSVLLHVFFVLVHSRSNSYTSGEISMAILSARLSSLLSQKSVAAKESFFVFVVGSGRLGKRDHQLRLKSTHPPKIQVKATYASWKLSLEDWTGFEMFDIDVGGNVSTFPGGIRTPWKKEAMSRNGKAHDKRYTLDSALEWSFIIEIFRITYYRPFGKVNWGKG